MSPAFRSLLFVLLLVTVAVVGLGCRELPDPEVDSLARTLRKLDTAQRPNGEDLPAELYVAWSARRDAGLDPADELSNRLRGIVDLEHALIVRLGTVPASTPDAREILDAYTRAHKQAYHGMAETLVARRLGDKQRADVADAEVRASLVALRAARALRRTRCSSAGLPDRLPLEPEPAGGAAVGRPRPKT